MLKINDLEVVRGGYQILWGVSLVVKKGEIVCLLGPNGAGKSTLMNSVSGLLRCKAGSIGFLGERIDGLPSHQIVHKGLSHVLERRRLFPYLTVEENLRLGAYHGKAKEQRKETMDWIFDLFPPIKDQQKQFAHTLSGGQQQMVAIGRGLMSCPRLLMIDEPWLGLAPQYVGIIIEALQRINDEGVGIFFIEQNVEEALKFAKRGYVLESGRMALQGTTDELLKEQRMREVYLGI